MKQNRFSGAQADKLGRFIGQKISAFLGIKTGAKSNEGTYKGERVVIKSARFDNPFYGITKQMLKRIKGIILAKEINHNGIFDIWKVSLSNIPPVSISKGKTINFKVQDAMKNGWKIGRLKIDIPEYLEYSVSKTK